MPKQLFLELEPEKRRRIFEAGRREFAEHPYREASTNAIVKAAGISKGSLFKYFENKLDLYFYVLDSVVTGLFQDLDSNAMKLEGDIFDILVRYAGIEFDWHMRNPDSYKLLRRAFVNDNSQLYLQTAERYKLAGDSMYSGLMQNLDPEMFRGDKDKVVNLIKWVLEGYNSAFVRADTSSDDIEATRDAYIKGMKEYLKLLKQGILK